MHTSPSPNAHGQVVTDLRAIEDEIVVTKSSWYSSSRTLGSCRSGLSLGGSASRLQDRPRVMLSVPRNIDALVIQHCSSTAPTPTSVLADLTRAASGYNAIFSTP